MRGRRPSNPRVTTARGQEGENPGVGLVRRHPGLSENTMSLTNNGSPRDNTRESLPAPTNLLPPEERRSTEFYLLSFEILEGELEELIDRLQHDSAFMDLGDREPYEDRIGDIERELLARRE
jgi:hypothetical protein